MLLINTKNLFFYMNLLTTATTVEYQINCFKCKQKVSECSTQKQWKNEVKVWFGVLALKLPQFMCPSNYGQKEGIRDERWKKADSGRKAFKRAMFVLFVSTFPIRFCKQKISGLTTAGKNNFHHQIKMKRNEMARNWNEGKISERKWMCQECCSQ